MSRFLLLIVVIITVAVAFRPTGEIYCTGHSVMLE